MSRRVSPASERSWHAERLAEDKPFGPSNWHESASGREAYAEQQRRTFAVIDKLPPPIRRHVHEWGWSERKRMPKPRLY